MARPWCFGNVVELRPLETVTSGRPLHLRALGAWGMLTFSFLGSLASLVSLFKLPPLPGGLIYHAVLASAMLIFFILAIISVWDQYRRWSLYQRAVHYLHMLAHRLRDRVDIPSIIAFQQQPYLVGHPTKSPQNRLLYEVIDDICELLKSLTASGSVAVNLLIPISPTTGNRPTELTAGLWSKPYDAPTRMRRAPDKNNRRFRSTLAIDSSIAGHVYDTKHSVLVRDTKCSMGALKFDTTDGRTRGEGTYQYVRSLICVPVVLRASEPQFVLAFDCNKPRQFHPDYIEIARMGADLLALVCALPMSSPLDRCLRA
jgi:hypothetical protein